MSIFRGVLGVGECMGVWGCAGTCVCVSPVVVVTARRNRPIKADPIVGLGREVCVACQPAGTLVATWCVCVCV